MTIESVPSGATVVIDGMPVGRTPYRFVVTDAARGFFRGETVIRVRFIAGAAGEVSATVSEVFGPTDRVPLKLVFTPEGVRRVL